MRRCARCLEDIRECCCLDEDEEHDLGPGEDDGDEDEEGAA